MFPETTLFSETTFKPKPVRCSLTDRIMSLYLSGPFGVREAVAKATRNDLIYVDLGAALDYAVKNLATRLE
jgi:hypothetical protein